MTRTVLIDRSSSAAGAVSPRTRERPARRGSAEQSDGFGRAPRPACLADDGERRLPTARQRLATALDRIDALETEALHLRHQVALLQRAAVRARQSAHHDALTGLPNRRLLADRYRQAAALAGRQHRLLALLFLDLDDFKAINDTHGHATGDAVLQQVAARLRACIRTSDTACRLGGDEFVVLLPDIAEPASAVAVAEKVRAQFAAPFVVGDVTLALTASIGISVRPIDGSDCAELLQAADAAMYRAKGSGARMSVAPAGRGGGVLASAGLGD